MIVLMGPISHDYIPTILLVMWETPEVLPPAEEVLRTMIVGMRRRRKRRKWMWLLRHYYVTEGG